MSMLYIWHPTIIKTGNLVQLMITRGDSDQVGKGSKAFAQSLLHIAGISAEPKTWKIESFRCNFYSEYWQDDDWQSRWDFVWRCRIETSEPATKVKAATYVGIDEIDEHSPQVDRYKMPPYRGLVIAEFTSETRAKAADDAIRSDVPASKKKQGKGHSTSSAIFKIAAKKFHLHIDVGSGDEAFFSKNAYPEKVVELCEEHGGLIHVQTQ